MEVSVLDVGRQKPHGERIDAEDVDPGDGSEVALRAALAHAVDRADSRDDRVHLRREREMPSRRARDARTGRARARGRARRPHAWLYIMVLTKSSVAIATAMSAHAMPDAALLLGLGPLIYMQMRSVSEYMHSMLV